MCALKSTIRADLLSRCHPCVCPPINQTSVVKAFKANFNQGPFSNSQRRDVINNTYSFLCVPCYSHFYETSNIDVHVQAHCVCPCVPGVRLALIAFFKMLFCSPFTKS